MTEKLDKLSSDILTLLKNHEPERLRHHEICDSLFNSYQYNYKDKHVFGVAVTQKLKLLEAKGLIIHEGIWYGTPNSKPIAEAEKPSTEKLKKKAEKERREQILNQKLNLLRAAQYCELVAKFNPNASACLELAKNYREQVKELDKEF